MATAIDFDSTLVEEDTEDDRPTDFSQRYNESFGEDEEEQFRPPRKYIDDSVKVYYTEDTPLETPSNARSAATSMTDLREIMMTGEMVDTKVDFRKPMPTILVRQSNPAPVRALSVPVQMSRVKPIPPPRVASLPKSGQDTPRIYCTEGTPYAILSAASSMTDLKDILVGDMDGLSLKDDSKRKADEIRNSRQRNGLNPVTITAKSIVSKGKPIPPPKPANLQLRHRPLPPPKPANLNARKCEAEKQAPVQQCIEKPVLFKEEETILETPLMFSRTSSPDSLSSVDIKMTNGMPNTDDVGSVISEFSRITSLAVSPSDLPDSPGQTVPSTPDRTVPSTPVIFNSYSTPCQSPEVNERRGEFPEDDDEDDDDEILKRCISQGMSSSSDHGRENIYEASSSGDEVEDDEDDALIQHCIAMGMPANRNEASVKV
ncbi:hypothetical protein HDE_10044 [Halotydeus destructor]|nr:hypothetical protein HDE_10044 [Halotydeus destructor]